MRARSRSSFAAWCAALACMLVLPTAVRADETRTYRNGLDGYEGTEAVNISSLGLTPSGSGMNGTTFTDGGDWCIGDLPATLGYDISPLLRFEGIEPIAGHHLVAATLRIRVIWWESGAPRVVVRYLAVPWAGAMSGDAIGWRTRDVGVSWSALGAEAEGEDVIASAIAMSTELTTTGDQTVDIALDPAIVTTWLLDPAANHGVVLRVDLPNHHVGFVPPLSTKTFERPTLLLTFAPGDALPQSDAGVVGDASVGEDAGSLPGDGGSAGGCSVGGRGTSPAAPFVIACVVCLGFVRRFGGARRGRV